MATAPVAANRHPAISTPKTSPRRSPSPTMIPDTASGAIATASTSFRPRNRRVVSTATTTPIGSASRVAALANVSELRIAGHGRT